MKKLPQVEDATSAPNDCPAQGVCEPLLSRRDAVVKVGSWIVYLGALGGASMLAANCGPATPTSSGAQNSPTPNGSETPTPTGATPTPTGSATPTGTPNAACGCGTTPSGSSWHNTNLQASQVPLNAVAYNSSTQIFICHDDQGYYAMDSLCPHEGCDMGTSNGHYTQNNLSAGFTCYCHGSDFDANGNVQAGSATSKSIPHYLLTTDSTGKFFVDWSQTVDKTCRC